MIKTEDNVVHEVSAQARGGKGRKLGMILGADEPYFLTSTGKVLLHPEENMIKTLPGEHEDLLFIITKQGIGKYVKFEKTGRIISLKEGDEVVDAVFTSGEEDIIVATEDGQALLIKGSEIPTLGETAQGVHIIKGGEVAGCDIVRKYLVPVSRAGLGKRVKASEFVPHHRYGMGIKIIGEGKLAGIVSVDDGDDIIVCSEKGYVLKTPADQIPLQGRTSKGCILMKLELGDYLAKLTREES